MRRLPLQAWLLHLPLPLLLLLVLQDSSVAYHLVRRSRGHAKQQQQLQLVVLLLTTMVVVAIVCSLCEYVIRVSALPAAALHTMPAMMQVRGGWVEGAGEGADLQPRLAWRGMSCAAGPGWLWTTLKYRSWSLRSG